MCMLESDKMIMIGHWNWRITMHEGNYKILAQLYVREIYAAITIT